MEKTGIKTIDIEHEMQQSYLDYAMSVIASRALPDARDGMKPVQRRILYAMYDMGLRPNSAYKKSARIVGEVLGKYHPHGDMAVYDAMARLAQEFSMRYQAVDGQGNFGSVDGDPPAAMRYTEARMTEYSLDILNQIDKNTVNFNRNFDETLVEPEVLPAAVPNLLLNGASGIAVGMSTSIPPHNFTELTNAMSYMIDEWERMDDIPVSDLLRFVKGPDFPTGGIIIQEDEHNDILTAYSTGKGRVTVRGRVHLEEMDRGKSKIIISELPYQTNKSSLIEKIADLVREGKIEGILDLRDESDRQGMRIVIEVSKTVDTNKILRDLYQKTPLQSTFSITLLALVNGEPRLLNLKQALRVYLEHRIEVVKRRSEYDLKQAKDRAHILEGLRIAIKYLDEIIAIIRRAADTNEAQEKLIKKFDLSPIQAQAILDMPLKRISSLERKKIEQECKDVLNLIKELEALLKSRQRIREAVKNELIELLPKYADPRRTQIISLEQGVSAKSLLTSRDVMPVEETWVGILEDGTAGRTIGNKLMRLSGKSSPRWLLKTDTHQILYLVSASGRAASLAVSTLPPVEQFTDGVHVSKVSAFAPAETIADAFCIDIKENQDANYFTTISKLGLIKRSAVAELPGPTASMFVAGKTNDGDQIVSAFVADENKQYVILTREGMVIRFGMDEVRPMGLIAAGVNAIKLKGKDTVLRAVAVQEDKQLLMVSDAGTGWRVNINDIPVQGRYGQGVIAARLKGTEELAAALYGPNYQSGYTNFGRLAIRIVRVDDVPLTRRGSGGKVMYDLKNADKVSHIVPEEDFTSGKRKPRKNGAEGETEQDKPEAKANKKPVARQMELTAVKKAPATKTSAKSKTAPVSKAKVTKGTKSGKS